MSAQYLIDGLPLWADWYIYPLSLAAWPADSAPVFDRPGATWADHLATVRQRLRDLTPAGPPPSAAAHTYLTLVEAALPA